MAKHSKIIIDPIFRSKIKTKVKLIKRTSPFKKLSYDLFFKEIIKKTPKLIESFNSFSKSEQRRFVDPNKRFSFERKTVHYGKMGSNFYKAVIRLDKKIIRFFIKETRPRPDISIPLLKRGSNGFSESKAIKTLSKLGISVIPARFSFVDNNRSFIAYDYVDLPTLVDAKINNQIDLKEYKDISQKLEVLNRSLKESYKIDNVTAENVFIDLKTKELYIFDPLPKSEI